ncbi:MAG: response regulator [Synergistaceae bacterium]|jgi:putative two-component system response regulator|nr:response regulator [Synergistaceae bacterium]
MEGPKSVTMPGERKKIVLVDDSPIILKLARNTLMNRYDVFTMPSVEKMFQFLERTLPNLILLDILMPETSGYEAIEILKKDPRTVDIPVIFLTSQSDADSELEGLSLGAVDYIAKPFSPQLLLKRVEIHMLLETQKQELQNLNDNLMEMVKQKTGSILELQKAVLATMSNLVEYRDDVTGSHVERTEHFLTRFVDEMLGRNVYGDILATWDIDLFLQSAQLHDVGKIAIRDSILLKPGKLTGEEFEEMKKHTTFGETVIEKIQQSARESMFLTHARIMAGTHHEKWDGTGYPRGIAGSGIPLQGRLMAIADVYDALVSSRPYKEAFTHQQAVQIIENESGSHFDPELIDVFLASHDSFQ